MQHKHTYLSGEKQTEHAYIFPHYPALHFCHFTGSRLVVTSAFFLTVKLISATVQLRLNALLEDIWLVDKGREPGASNLSPASFYCVYICVCLPKI